MGWFWADEAPAPAPFKPPHHPRMTANVEIPPECPMHKPKSSSAAPPTTPPPPPTNNILSTSFQSHDSSAIEHDQHTEPTPSRPWSSYLNPLNLMPTLSNTPAPEQKTVLPTARVISSIPKGVDPAEGNWEYPSPQQMYNAMLRKGYDDTPEDAVESMVEVHNFLNEGAWAEIVGWERQFAGGLWRGVRVAGRGGDPEGTLDQEDAEREWMKGGEARVWKARPRLLRFQGRPGEPSPKAKMFNALGYVSSRFGGLPFDRHDWYVLRTTSDDEKGGAQTEVRYVIDYYSGPPEPTGESVFYLDVRPALDRPGALFERGIRWSGEIWWKASGGQVREEEKRRKAQEKEASVF
ncbi:holocytochrome c synthase [Orbilia brochopaga]|uniref:Holocytochrome c-type synthase n=1 Tax=Orbilia brochopaga TaxID=3140254 RepID=A0AAV9V2H1_9PEZI